MDDSLQSPDSAPSRRTVLVSGAAALGTALAGCLGGPDGGPGDEGDGDDGDDGETGQATPADRVPAGARVVVHADVGALLDDGVARGRINDVLAAASAGVDRVEAALDGVEREYGLDVRELRELTAFAGFEPDAPAGVRFEAGWSASAIREAIAPDEVDSRSEDYRGYAVRHVSDETALGVLGEGTYVAGTTAGVEAAIDVEAGEAEPVGGVVRDGFEAAPSGPVRFAFELPADVGEETSAATDRGMDPSAVAAITHGYGGYAIDGDDRRGSTTLETDSADAASRLADDLETALAGAREEISLNPRANEELVEQTGELLTSIDVRAEGSTVRLTADRGEVVPVVLVAVLASFVLGMGDQPGPVAPAATFEFEYDATEGLLTVTHYGGDVIRADELYLRGEGFASASGADVDGPGAWAGTTSATTGGNPAVAAGDSVAVGVESDYGIRVVWEPVDADATATIATHAGPDA